MVKYWHDGMERLYVFAGGSEGNLWVLVGAGQTFSWTDQGPPPGSRVVGSTSTVVYNHQGQEQIYCFVTSAAGDLWVHFWDKPRGQWRWANQGRPQGTTVASTPRAVTLDTRMVVFVVGNNNQLYTRTWDGTTWLWEQLGTP